MSIPKIRRPSPATAIAILALVVAMGGTAEAVRTQAIVRARDIAPGAVHSKAIAKGAVSARKLRKASVTAPKLALGSVDASAIAPGAVTAGALAPGSIYGGAFGTVTLHTAALVDRDAVPSNPEWTTSDTATAACSPGERVLSGGVVFTNPGNREVGVVTSVPVSGSGSGWMGQITSNSGGTATAEVQALCLK